MNREMESGEGAALPRKRERFSKQRGLASENPAGPTGYGLAAPDEFLWKPCTQWGMIESDHRPERTIRTQKR